jgi:hypothetical protein
MSVLMNAAGAAPLAGNRCRATTPAGRPGNKGLRYRADPPTVDEIVA